MGDAKPSPLPWSWDGGSISDANYNDVVSQEPGAAYESYGPLILSSANAELIVRAVNAHDDLLAELAALLSAVEEGHADAGSTNRCPLCVAVKSARAALAKAGAR